MDSYRKVHLRYNEIDSDIFGNKFKLVRLGDTFLDFDLFGTQIGEGEPVFLFDSDKPDKNLDSSNVLDVCILSLDNIEKLFKLLHQIEMEEKRYKYTHDDIVCAMLIRRITKSNLPNLAIPPCPLCHSPIKLENSITDSFLVTSFISRKSSYNTHTYRTFIHKECAENMYKTSNEVDLKEVILTRLI